MNHGIKHISITQPCTQNWADMDIAAQGRFCQSCQKTVTDFTKLSNQQIIEALSSSGNTCGRISQLQLRTLNASLTTDPQSKYISWRKFSIAAILISVLSLFRTEAKSVAPKTVQYQTFEFKKAAVSIGATDEQRTITGKIVDENDEPLPGVTIKIKGTHQGVVTNVDGSFSIKVPLDKKVKLQIAYIGYENMEIKLRPHDNNKLSLKMKINNVMLGGMGIVYHSSKTPIA